VERGIVDGSLWLDSRLIFDTDGSPWWLQAGAGVTLAHLSACMWEFGCGASAAAVPARVAEELSALPPAALPIMVRSAFSPVQLFWNAACGLRTPSSYTRQMLLAAVITQLRLQLLTVMLMLMSRC
jgi:hypothetical protein